jgi:tetratricopeptide (TPR) repeat protein|eukprot:scaffold248548_cov77-Cyclotella_meneghiniana.AAC.4
MVSQNVQITSSQSAASAGAAAAANQPPPKVETSNAVTQSGSSSSRTNNGRPSNKRSSIGNSFFNAIARRRISPPFPGNVHSMTTADQVITEHIMCPSPNYTGSFPEGMLLSPQQQWKDVSLLTPPYQAAFFSMNQVFNNEAPIHAQNNRVLKTIHSIIELNDAASEYYHMGVYDSALEALREAESRRERIDFKPLPFARSGSALNGKRCADNDAGINCSPSSYIYQRMDFDEGMHSYSSLQKLDGAQVIYFVPSEHSHDSNAFVQLKSSVVQATLLFNIGQVLRRRGEFDAATFKYKAALDALKGAIMVNHELVIPILHNIGQLEYRRGELSTAMETYEKALFYARSMEDGTIHVASALNCLGVLHYHANSSDNDDDSEEPTKDRLEGSSTDKAMELFQQALSLRKQCLGPNHVDVATTLNNIGRIHVQRDRFDEALGYYQDALRIRRVCLGTDSLDYAATAFNAGQSLHQKGDLDEAIELYHEFLRVATIKFGKSHRDIAVVLSGIAQIHQEQKNYEKALELYEESLLAGQAALGEYHSEIAMLLNRMGNFHFEQERLSDALKCYKKGLCIELKVLPPDHPNIVVTYSNLGEIHRQRCEWDEAAQMYGEALEILKKKHDGTDNAEVSSTLNTLGLINDQKGDTCVGLKYLREALEMRRRLLANNKDNDQMSLDVAATLVYIGTILYRRSLFPAAIELFTESLQLRQKILGNDHRDTAFVMYNIALVYQQQGDYDKSIHFFTETLRTERITLGERHKDVCMTLFKLGEVNKAAGKLAEALQCFQESLEIERGLASNSSPLVRRRHHSHGPDIAAMARTLTEIGNIHLTNNDVVPMMDAFNEASRLYRIAGLSPQNIVISGQHAYAIEFSFPEAAPAA